MQDRARRAKLDTSRRARNTREFEVYNAGDGEARARNAARAVAADCSSAGFSTCRRPDDDGAAAGRWERGRSDPDAKGCCFAQGWVRGWRIFFFLLKTLGYIVVYRCVNFVCWFEFHKLLYLNVFRTRGITFFATYSIYGSLYASIYYE